MSRKAPLYDPNMINDDLRCTGMSIPAQLLFAKFVALANNAGGYIAIGEARVSLERAAAAIGFNQVIEGIAQEIISMGLLEEDERGWYIPEMKKAQNLRDKRSRAGKKGGDTTTINRTDVAANNNRDRQNGGRWKAQQSNVYPFCSSKSNYSTKTEIYEQAAKKEKRTKKEKNNKYIYIFGEKVFIGDQGDREASNGAWMSFENFTVYRRTYEALQRAFPSFTEDRLDELLTGHDAWLAARPDIRPEYWLGLFLSGARTLHERQTGEPHPSRQSANQNQPQSAKQEAA